MRVQSQANKPFDPHELLGVAISSIHQNQRHVGLIYSDDNNQPQLCHLAWHHKLKDEPLPPQYLWGVSGLDQFNKPFMAAYVSLLKQNSTPVPYGIDYADYSGLYFDDQGNYIEQPIGRGLTCATFILAVFNRKGFNLLQTATWPQRQDDVNWQNQIISTLSNQATSEHVEAMKQNIGAIRFRPEEVAAGVISEDIPLDFTSALAIAIEILSDIYH